MKYVVFLYFGAQLMRTLHAADFATVAAVCDDWWSADPRNVCSWSVQQ